MLYLASAAACPLVPWFPDGDGDGHGSRRWEVGHCEGVDPGAGWARVAGDCRDGDPAVHPGVRERCNDRDDDCDGLVDEGVPLGGGLWYPDGDGDGVGVAVTPVWACTAPPGRAAAVGDCDDTDARYTSACPPPFTYALAFGDLHAHSNLSHDGCEDAAAWCVPEGATPAELLATYAADLDFVALTDHAEYDRYLYAAGGLDLDVWEEQQRVLQDAEGGAVLPVLGYEFTGTRGHRTVIFEDLEVCEAYRIKATATDGSKSDLGLEAYTPEAASGVSTGVDFEAAMADAATTTGCEGLRWASWYHHPAYTNPTDVDWSVAAVAASTDVVVEIASEHGSSECADLSWDGCSFRVDAGRYEPEGSVQAALSAGFELGFVGGSDNHEGRGFQFGDGGGHVGQFVDADDDGTYDEVRTHPYDGALTGVYTTGTLDRTALLDALDARRTLAATWLPEGLVIFAWRGSELYLPGDDVAAGDLFVHVDLDDPTVSSWQAELVDPMDGATGEVGAVSLAAGDVRYVRIRAWIDGEEQRIWASPWFGR